MHLFFLIFMCSKLYMPLFDFWLIIVSRDTYICIYMFRPLVGFMSYHHMWDDNLVYTRKHKCEYASDGIPVNSIHYIWDILCVTLIWILIWSLMYGFKLAYIYAGDLISIFWSDFWFITSLVHDWDPGIRSNLLLIYLLMIWFCCFDQFHVQMWFCLSPMHMYMDLSHSWSCFSYIYVFHLNCTALPHQSHTYSYTYKTNFCYVF